MNRLCPNGHSYSGSRCNICNKTKARGYGHDWRKLQERKRTINPLCENCENDGLTRPMDEVHHIVPIEIDPRLRLEWTNLRSLCRWCHLVEHGKTPTWDR